MKVVISESDLAGLTTLEAIMDWAGLVGTDDVSTSRGSFLRSVGADTTTIPRAVGVINEADFAAVVAEARIETPGLAVDDPPIQTPPNLVQRGHMLLVGHICRLTTWAVAPVTSPYSPVQQQQLALAATAFGPTVRKIKLGNILRQADDTEVPVVDDSIMSTGYARWERLHGIGSRPPPDADVTSEQITGLAHVLEAGSVPYCDFAIWGPHGHRRERKLRLTGSVFNSDGSFRTVELVGPPTLDVWMDSYQVMITAFIMLDALDLGVLHAYRDHIQRLHARYGPDTWLLLYQADTRFRLEHIERTRRNLADAHQKAIMANGTTPFEVKRPWNYTFQISLNDASWWALEFVEPAMLFITRSSALSSLVSGEAPILGITGRNNSAEQTPGLSGPTNRKDSDSARPGKRPKNRQHHVDSGKYTANRAGDKLCADFQTGKCGSTVGESRCPVNRDLVHQCARCLAREHGEHSCTGSAPPSHFPADKGKGKYKGGKGGKGKGRHW